MRTHGLALSIRGFILSFVMVGSALISSCGGGGGGGGTPPPPADPTGYYSSGTLTLKDSTTPNAAPITLTGLKGIIANNRLMMFTNIDPANDYSFDAKLTMSSTTYTATVTVYKDGIMLANNIPVNGGLVTQGASLSGSIAVSSTVSGQFTLTFDKSISTQTATLARIVDPMNTTVGVIFSGLLPGATTSVFNPAFLGNTVEPTTVDLETGLQTTQGIFSRCFLQNGNSGTNLGSVSILAKSNIYNINFGSLIFCNSATVSGNNYSGLATLFTTVNTDDTMIFMMANGKYHFYGVFTRI